MRMEQTPNELYPIRRWINFESSGLTFVLVITNITRLTFGHYRANVWCGWKSSSLKISYKSFDDKGSIHQKASDGPNPNVTFYARRTVPYHFMLEKGGRIFILLLTQLHSASPFGVKSPPRSHWKRGCLAFSTNASRKNITKMPIHKECSPLFA